MKGVVAAVPTPIDSNGRPQRELFLEHCRWALANGCDGLNILGSTGEANSFTGEDRKLIMEWAAKSLDVTQLMVGTGTPSLGETISLSKHAARLGFATALVLPPYYYKPVTDEGLIGWYAALDAALSGHPINVYFYNFPQMTGIDISVSVIAALTERFPERFTGIKDSSGDLGYCREVVSLAQKLSVFPSSESSLAESHQSGFAGCISATANITAPLCAEIWASRTRPDTETVAEIDRQRTAMAGPSLIASVKHLVGIRSGEASWRNVLPPFQKLGEASGRKLEREIFA